MLAYHNDPQIKSDALATIFRVAFQFAFTVAVLAIPVAAVVYLYRVMQ